MTDDNLKLDLPNFEGPLDLLLHLIRSQKIDIYDIPIAQITRQYLSYLHKMQKLNLQIAGEYFVMSSTLLHIKSQSLLPKNDFVNEEERQDPREELVEQLVQYSVFKRIAAYFEKRAARRPLLLAKEASVDVNKKVEPLPRGEISAAALKTAFITVFKRAKMRHPGSLTVKMKERPLTEMVAYLSNQLQRTKEISFFACAGRMANIYDVIGLFLAMLELGKKGRIKIKQKRIFGDLKLERISNG